MGSSAQCSSYQNRFRHVKPNFFVSRAPFLRIVPEERGPGRMEIEIKRFLSGFSGVLPDSLLNRESRGKIKREPLGRSSGSIRRSAWNLSPGRRDSPTNPSGNNSVPSPANLRRVSAAACQDDRQNRLGTSRYYLSEIFALVRAKSAATIFSMKYHHTNDGSNEPP